MRSAAENTLEKSDGLGQRAKKQRNEGMVSLQVKCFLQSRKEKVCLFVSCRAAEEQQKRALHLR